MLHSGDGGQEMAQVVYAGPITKSGQPEIKVGPQVGDSSEKSAALPGIPHFVFGQIFHQYVQAYLMADGDELPAEIDGQLMVTSVGEEAQLPAHSRARQDQQRAFMMRLKELVDPHDILRETPLPIAIIAAIHDAARETAKQIKALAPPGTKFIPEVSLDVSPRQRKRAERLINIPGLLQKAADLIRDPMATCTIPADKNILHMIQSLASHGIIPPPRVEDDQVYVNAKTILALSQMSKHIRPAKSIPILRDIIRPLAAAITGFTYFDHTADPIAASTMEKEGVSPQFAKMIAAPISRLDGLSFELAPGHDDEKEELAAAIKFVSRNKNRPLLDILGLIRDNPQQLKHVDTFIKAVLDGKINLTILLEIKGDFTQYRSAEGKTIHGSHTLSREKHKHIQEMGHEVFTLYHWLSRLMYVSQALTGKSRPEYADFFGLMASDTATRKNSVDALHLHMSHHIRTILAYAFIPLVDSRPDWVKLNEADDLSQSADLDKEKVGNLLRRLFVASQDNPDAEDIMASQRSISHLKGVDPTFDMRPNPHHIQVEDIPLDEIFSAFLRTGDRILRSVSGVDAKSIKPIREYLDILNEAVDVASKIDALQIELGLPHATPIDTIEALNPELARLIKLLETYKTALDEATV